MISEFEDASFELSFTRGCVGFIMITISQETSERIKVLNVICTAMVVAIHSRPNVELPLYSPSYLFQEFFSNGLSRVAVPMFFLISGILFFKDSTHALNHYPKKIRARIHSLVIPYLTCSLFVLALNFGIQTGVRSFPALGKVINGPTSGLLEKPAIDLLQIWLVSPLTAHLWFLRDLMFMALLAPIVLWLFQRLGLSLILLLFGLWFFQINVLPYLGDWRLIRIDSIFFFSIGAYLSSRKIELDTTFYQTLDRIGYPLLGSWLLLNFARILLNPDFDIANKFQFTALGLVLHQLSIVIGIGALIFISPKARNKTVLKLSVFSFFIYLFHTPLCWYISKLFYLLGARETLQFVLTIFTTLVTTCLTGMLLKTRMSSFYAVVAGGRGA